MWFKQIQQHMIANFMKAVLMLIIYNIKISFKKEIFLRNIYF